MKKYLAQDRMEFEKLMMKTIRVWQVLFILFSAAICCVLFGWFVKRALHGDERLGRLRPVIIAVANFPSLVKQTYVELKGKRSPLLLNNRFPEIDGFKKNGVLQPGAAADDGYLLLSAYDYKKGQSTVKLIRIRDEQVLHEWVPNIPDLIAYQNSEPSLLSSNEMQPSRYQAIHALLLGDGGIVFKNAGPLFKINACSQIEWKVNGFFHHSIEQGPDGNFWVPSHIESAFYNKVELVRPNDDAIAQVSPKGEVLFKKSVPKILDENGYRGLLFGAGPYENDVIHLNDIQPALYSTEYWEKGDLLISMRNRSTVFLYRPSTDEIIWLKTGPWLNQHDPDFIGQSKISIFGNDVIRTKGSASIELQNNIYLFDFADGSLSTPYSEILTELDVNTATGGQQELLENGDIFIEETNHGRLLRVSPEQIIWQYTVKVDDTTLGMSSWSRYLTKEQVLNILPVLGKKSCN